VAIFIFHVGAIHFLRSFISFFRSFILPLRRKCFVPTWGSFRPSVGIISSLRGDFEIPPLGFFRPTRGGRFSSHQYGTASYADYPHRGWLPHGTPHWARTCGSIPGSVGSKSLVVSTFYPVTIVRAILSRYFCQEELSLFWHIICSSPNACLLHGGGYGK